MMVLLETRDSWMKGIALGPQPMVAFGLSSSKKQAQKH